MSAYSNLRYEPPPEDRLIRQVIAICAKHGISYGSPEDLRGFVRALDTDKHLAMDFWSMVARMSEQGAVEEPDWLLNIIVEGVTGQALAKLTTPGSPYQIPIQQLRSLVSGEDVHPPASDPDPSARKPVRAVYSAAPAPAPNPPAPYIAGRRLSLDPDPPVIPAPRPATQSQSPHEELNWVIPLESYAESNSNSRRSGPFVAGALAILVLLGCAAFVVQYHQRLSNALRAGASSALDAWNGSPTVALASTPQPAATSPSTQRGPTSSHPGNTTAASSPQPSARLATNNSTSEERGDADAAAPASGGGRVVVPEILMRQNLVSSPTPTSAYGQGRVVMEATVTKHGNISHIHVVSGDSALRQAAINAALSRRYTPYLLNGNPVDVSTTITLDF